VQDYQLTGPRSQWIGQIKTLERGQHLARSAAFLFEALGSRAGKMPALQGFAPPYCSFLKAFASQKARLIAHL
jgi:hypothetical protein